MSCTLRNYMTSMKWCFVSLRRNSISSISKLEKLLSIKEARALNLQLIEFLREEWGLLHSKGVLLSPLYPSKVVEEISLEVLSNWLRLERFFSKEGTSYADRSHGSLCSGSNILITGPRGVGKTTLMNGLKEVINVHMINVKTLSLNYEENPADIMISNFLNGFDGSKYLTSKYLDTYCDSNSHGLLFFGDEIQSLYEKGKNMELASKAVLEILCVGKSHHAMGVISGSSSNVRHLAFNKHIIENHAFPSLNDTVYREKYLSPLRTEEEIKEVLKIKGVDTEIDPLKVFLESGGVGRYINVMVTGHSNEQLLEKMAIELNEDSLFFSVMSALYNEYEIDEIPTWNMKQISYKTIRDLKAVNKINEWRDKSFIYRNNAGDYELLIPNYLMILRKHFETQDKQLLLALQSTLRGWRGFGSAGQAVEPHIFQRYISKKVIIFQDWVFHNEYLSFANQPSSSTKNKKVITLNDQELPIYVNRVIALNNDMGIDAFVMEPYTENEEESIKVTIIQVKVGERTKLISMGTIHSGNSNEHLTAILRKANNGFKILSEQFKQHFNRNIICSNFVLVTSKVIHNDVKSLPTVQINGTNVTFTYLGKEVFDEIFADELNDLNMTTE